MTLSKTKATVPLHGLGRVGWLAQQPEEFQQRIAAIGRWANVAAGERLYMVGDEPTAIFGLEDGLLDVTVALNSDEEITLHRGTPGFWIGESALLSENRCAVTVTAASPVRVLKLPASSIRRNLLEHPEDWPCFYRLSHENTMLTARGLAEVLALPPRARFARILLRLAMPDGTVRVTQEELGTLAGMSRAAFRRAFVSLIETSVVHTDYGVIRILDRAALERAARMR